jgi:hypothetical protein
MQRVNYLNKLGYPNSIALKIIKKKSKSITVHLPDDEEKLIREIDRKSVDTIEEVKELNRWE